MFDKTVAALTKGLQYIARDPKFLLTLLLIVIVPIAFLYTASEFQKVGRANQERLENDRIGLLHDVFASLIRVSEGDIEAIQQEIDELVFLNPDITIFHLATEIDDAIVPVAAYNRDSIGVEAEGDIYRLAYTHEGESLIFSFFRDGKRFIQGVRVITINDTDYFILTEVSRANVDALFAERELKAQITLYIVLIVVTLLIIRHVFIVNYGYLYREARKTIESRDMFTNMIAHELRAPLTAIRGYASLIEEDDNMRPDVKEQARRIESSAHRLVLIVNDLLDVARIQSGKLSVTKEHIDVSKIINEVIDELLSSAKYKQVELSADGTHKPVNIFGDKKRLHQALTNLVSNSIKYTKEGEIQVALTERADRIEIRVKDTGMGIAAKDQKRLFAPFFRVKNQTVDKTTGTGLGMWITKQLIEAMGGSIGVESIRGIGTHIVVTIAKNEKNKV